MSTSNNRALSYTRHAAVRGDCGKLSINRLIQESYR